MKNLSGGVLILISALTISCNEGEEGAIALKTQQDSVSYSYGVQIAESIKQSGKKNLDAEVIAKALKEAYEGNSQLTLEQCQEIIQGDQQRAADELAGKNTAYLEENAKKEGVQTTESGLQYREITAGTGASPAATDNVTVHYTGKLVDGTVFDSSVERGEPVQFPLNGVIPGWTEGLQLMKEGGKAELVIPSNLGYGPRGAGGVIPPNATLIFEVELISIDK